MKLPTMPLSTVVVLNKVSYVDFVTITELRKFEFLTSKNNQQSDPRMTQKLGFRGAGSSSWSHRSYWAGSGAGEQFSQNLGIIFSMDNFLATCHNATSITLVVLGARS